MFTLQDFEDAFKRWEEDFRSNPSKFLNKEEALEHGIQNTSKYKAEYFMDLLTENKE